MDEILPENDLVNLMNEAKQGNSTAFQKVYEQLFLPTFRYILRRVQDKSIAEDLTQTVFLKVYIARPTLTPNTSALAYFFTVARNCVSDHWKKNTRPVSSLESMENEIMTPPDTVAFEKHDTIIKGLEHLEEIQKKVLHLKFFDELSTQEIAFALGMTPNNIRQIQCRALKKLREHIAYE